MGWPPSASRVSSVLLNCCAPNWRWIWASRECRIWRPSIAAWYELEVKHDPPADFPCNGGGGVHGLEFAEGTLWVTSLKLQKLSQVDPRDFHVIHQIPVHLGRAHGLAWDPPGIWCMHSTDRVIHKLDARDGRILEQITLAKDDPDPHGMCMYNGHLYYCDAGIAPGGKD